MKKLKKAVLLGIIAVILGIFWITYGITENLQKDNSSGSIQAYNHNPNNILENVFESDGLTILPFIFDTPNQTITKVYVLEQFAKAGINIKNGNELGDIIVTGDKIQTDSKTYTVLIYGDVNKDGNVDVFDAQSVMRHFVYGEKYALTDIHKIAGNINNNDGEIDVFDAQRILRFYVGFEKKLVLNEPEASKRPDEPVNPDKEKPTYVVPTGLTAKYGQTLQDIRLPKGFSFEDELITKVGNVGTNKFNVTYTPDDTNKYEVVTGIEVEVVVEKAIPSYILPTGLTASYGQTLVNVKLPKGFSFEDELTTSVGDAGENIFKVTYTPDDIANYEIVTGIEVKILVGEEKEEPEYTIPTGLVAIYGDTLADVKLPKGFSFEDVLTTSVGNAGTNKFCVTYTPDDTDKYKIVRGIEVEIIVGKAVPKYTIPTGLTAKYGQTLADVKLPEGFSFEDRLTTNVGEAGTNKFTVSYTPDDTKNYRTVRGIKVSITVGKPLPSYTVPDGLTAKYGQTLADIELPKGFSFEDELTTSVGNAGENTFKVTYTPDDDTYSSVSGIDVIINVEKINIKIEAEIKENYYCFDEHLLTVDIGENAITNVTWDIKDSQGNQVEKSVADVQSEPANNGEIIGKFVAKSSGKYTIIPVVGNSIENADVEPVTLEIKDDPTVNSIVLKTMNDPVVSVSKITIRKNQTQKLSVHYYHDYENGTINEITTGANANIIVTPTPTETPSSTDNLQVVLQNADGNSITSSQNQETKYIWLKGLNKTNQDISLKIEINGKEVVNIPVTVQDEAPKTLQLGTVVNPTKLYLETPIEQDDMVSERLHTLVPLYLKSTDVPKISLKQKDVSDEKIKISVAGISDDITKYIFSLQGYDSKKVKAPNDATNIEFVGIRIEKDILEEIGEENLEKLMKANKIKISYEGTTKSYVELNIAIQEKQLGTIEAQLDEAQSNYSCYDEIGIKVKGGLCEEKITDSDTLTWKITKDKDNVPIMDDTAKITGGNIVNGVCAVTFKATKKGTYKITPTINTESGKTIIGNTLTVVVRDLTVDSINVSNTSIEVNEKENTTISVLFMHNGISNPIEVEANRITITPETSENIEIVLQNKEGNEIDRNSIQELASIYVKGLKQTTTPIKLKIEVDGQKEEIEIVVKPEALEQFEKGNENITEPITFSLTQSGNNETVLIPVQFKSGKKLTRNDILNRVKISFSPSIDTTIIEAVFDVSAYDSQKIKMNASQSNEKAEYIGIKVNTDILEEIPSDFMQTLASINQMKITCDGTQGQINLSVVMNQN